jgi:asparagine synthase (glutamine-hydrolysing)
VAEYISKHSSAKVIFNGDGSDEVSGGYMYFHCAPDKWAFDMECRRLLSDIHYFDVLRSDRCISSHGLEARTPFLDKTFVQTYLTFSRDLRFDMHNKHCEKYLIRKAFAGKGVLPEEVLWRTKEAFSDGVGEQSRGLYQIIPEYVKKNKYGDCEGQTHNSPQTEEQKFYMSMFACDYLTKSATVIPYRWMPRFIEGGASDSSARTLDIYSKKMGGMQSSSEEVVREADADVDAET